MVLFENFFVTFQSTPWSKNLPGCDCNLPCSSRYNRGMDDDDRDADVQDDDHDHDADGQDADIYIMMKCLSRKMSTF